MNTITIYTPRLHTVRVQLTNLTDHQARFLHGVIELITDNGEPLRLLERDRACVRMDARTGEAFTLPDSEPTAGRN